MFSFLFFFFFYIYWIKQTGASESMQISMMGPLLLIIVFAPIRADSCIEIIEKIRIKERLL